MRKTISKPMSRLPIVFGALTFAVATLGLLSCGRARPATEPSVTPCNTCHGSEQTAAPPRDLLGEHDPLSRGVGAHPAHVLTTRLRSPVPCESCHVVPPSEQDEHHLDNWPAQVTFSGLAVADSASPTLLVPQGTGVARDDRWLKVSCAGSYCHGATLKGGHQTQPSWNDPSPGKWTACDACHGAPPPPPHPQSSQCGRCHQGYTNTSVNAEQHVNGVIDLPAVACATCHGDPDRPATAVNPNLPAAPPTGTQGETETSQRAVGAHQAHLTDGQLSRGIACSECHVVPTAADHSNGTAEVSFGALATTGGVAPAWNGATCASSYCHGNFKNGTAANAPAWTQTHQADCGSCHAVPPGGSHPQNNACGTCHVGYTAASVNLDAHVNGVVDVHLTCSTCHGDGARQATAANPQLAAAPPKGTNGETQTTERAVGAHQAHLNDGTLSRAMPCAECHQVPTELSHSNGSVELAFGALAKAGGVSPSWNGTTCANSYCHGNFKNGTQSNAPGWTQANQAPCGSCHGLPPAGSHPANPQCGTCHTGYTSSTVNLTSHVNGVVDVASLSCTSCHGDGARQATTVNPQLPSAPPLGTHGETQTTDRAVGAHQAHLNDGMLRNALLCAECHPVPTSPAHSNGAVELTFGSLSKTGGVVPAWNGATCASSYCHGNFAGGKPSNAPNWTGVNQASCGSCHGAPPAAPHAQSATCGSCHPGYTGGIDKARHVNGTVEVSLTCASCHGDPARQPTTANPQLPAAPPQGTNGETLTSQRAVGAHQTHLVDGPMSRAMPCGECHTVPTSLSHSNGAPTVTFGSLSKTGGVSPNWNGATCTNSYCHGNFTNGATANAPSWTGTNQGACGSCHARPPGGTHPASPNCANCHPGYSSTLVNLATHINGTVDVSAMACTSCHGDPTRPATTKNPMLPAAPPLGTNGETLTTQRAVGAHQVHLHDGALSLAVACAECHVVPASLNHSNGTPTVTFGTLAKTGGATPSWTGTTCTNSYCHGRFTGGTTGNAPSWTGANQAACGTCHDLSPQTGKHPLHKQKNKDCDECHGAGFVGLATNKTVAPAVHVDGAVRVGGTGSGVTFYDWGNGECTPVCHEVQGWR